MNNLNPLYELKEFTREAITRASRKSKKVVDFALSQSTKRAKKATAAASKGGESVINTTRKSRKSTSRTPTQVGNSIWGQ